MDDNFHVMIDRINELWHKKKDAGLTEDEEKEQKRLRGKYLKIFKKNMKSQLDHVRIKEHDGSLTPLKNKNNSGVSDE